MQRNVGRVDAMIRITAGLVGLAYGIGKMNRRPHRTPWVLLTMSAMKVAEGATRFCPMLYAMDMDTVTKKGMTKVADKLTQAGVRAALNRMTGTSGTSAKTDESDLASAMAASVTSPQEGEKKELSPEDKMLEAAVREFVSVPEADRDKRPSERYSTDEHLYPTYS